MLRGRLVLHGLAVACVLVVCVPVLTGNWVGGHEGYSYLWRAAEVADQLRGGTLWPRWCPDFYWGFGYPFFVFYPPGVFVLSALLSAATPGLWWGLGLVAMLGSFSLFYGTRRLALLFVAERAARAAAVLASLATYRFAQLWVRGDYAESAAMGLIPWVLAEAVVLARGGPARAMGASAARLAMGVALVSFTHTLTAVMTCGALAVLGVTATVGAGGLRDRAGRLLRVGIPSLAGLVLSAAYWLPVAVQAPLVRFGDMVQPVAGSPSYHWGDHFPGLVQRVAPGFAFGGSVPGGDDGMSMATSLVGWGLIAAAVLLLRDPGARRRLVPLLGFWLLVQALLLPVSSPLWWWVPGLHMFQFPWRFLVMDALLVALVGAVVVDELDGRWPNASVAVVALSVGFSAPIALQCLAHAQSDPFPLGPRALAALEDPSQLQTLGAFHEASMRIPLTTAGRNEYLPRSVGSPPTQHPGSQGAPALPRDLGPAREQSGAWRRWRVRVPSSGQWEVSWFHFAGVQASVDGAAVPTRASERGVVSLPIEAGERVVDVWYGGTADQRLGAWLGGVGWLLALVLLGRGITGSSQSVDSRP